MKSRHLLLSFLAVLCSLGCDEKGSGSKLVVGMEMTYPPFESKDSAGKPQGVSVDLAQALGRHLGKEVVLKDMSFEGLPAALKSGRIDAIISSMTINEKRKKMVDFSDPYVRTGLALLVRKDSAIQSVEELKNPGIRVVVKIGTTGALYAQENLSRDQLTILDHAVACVEQVSSGKADAFIYDQVSILKNWEARKETTRALLEPFQEESWGIAVRKGEGELLRQINEFLAKFRAEDGFERLAEKYLGEEKQKIEELGTRLSF